MRRGLLVGMVIAAACGCDSVFGLNHPLDAAPDVAHDAPGDGGPDGPIDARPDTPSATTMCPSTYGIVGTQTTRYRLLPVGVAWATAEATCENDQVAGSTLHTHLAVIETEPERSQLNALTNQAAWIGLSDRKFDNTYLWVTAENLAVPSSGPPWASGQPGHQALNDCVLMNTTADFVETDCAALTPGWCECDDYAADSTRF